MYSADAEQIAEMEVLGKVYTSEEMARRLKAHPSTLYRIMDRGEIMPRPSGGKKGYRFTEYEARKNLKIIKD